MPTVKPKQWRATLMTRSIQICLSQLLTSAPTFESCFKYKGSSIPNIIQESGLCYVIQLHLQASVSALRQVPAKRVLISGLKFLATAD